MVGTRPGLDRWDLPFRLGRLLEAGARPGESGEERLRRSAMIVSATIMATCATVWTVTYAALGLWVPALIPLAYQAASGISIVVFVRTRRDRLFRATQLTLSLVLPFLLQWSLGGFLASSAVCVWAFTCPLGALLFLGARRALPWFLAFAGLVALSALVDPLLSPHAADVPTGLQTAFFALNILGVAVTTFGTLLYFVRERERILAELADQHEALRVEQAKSERLLLNVLPSPVAAQLKDRDGTIADDIPEVTVLFADIVDFSPLAERLPASELVALLDRVFGEWDALAVAHGVEKIKTIGDSYMVAGGVPIPRADHAEAVADLALAMVPALRRIRDESGLTLDVRIGIASGPVVAGVIGRAKFTYDLWGDTVNTASRMETTSKSMHIQISHSTYVLIDPKRYAVEDRGEVALKGRGNMRTYYIRRA